MDSAKQFKKINMAAKKKANALEKKGKEESNERIKQQKLI